MELITKLLTTIEGTLILKNIILYFINTLLALFTLYCFIEWIKFTFNFLDDVANSIKEKFNRRKK